MSAGICETTSVRDLAEKIFFDHPELQEGFWFVGSTVPEKVLRDSGAWEWAEEEYAHLMNLFE